MKCRTHHPKVTSEIFYQPLFLPLIFLLILFVRSSCETDVGGSLGDLTPPAPPSSCHTTDLEQCVIKGGIPEILRAEPLDSHEQQSLCTVKQFSGGRNRDVLRLEEHSREVGRKKVVLPGVNRKTDVGGSLGDLTPPAPPSSCHTTDLEQCVIKGGIPEILRAEPLDSHEQQSLCTSLQKSLDCALEVAENCKNGISEKDASVSSLVSEFVNLVQQKLNVKCSDQSLFKSKSFE
ncbi:unnamed protein product [Cyprideis torosa]|uniref:Uncharacterized protein n=1 Tax=Cyprideis torosa TaxID=163714 RepID=A0A7R8ZND0_9CRUS|nr:unnamed protein product [Cyprideis torosa]CAG0891299.1 unnamed protein product [Cyprideis torosa]